MTRSGKLSLLAQIYRLELLAEVCGETKGRGVDTPAARSFVEEREHVRHQIERALGCGSG